MSPISMIDRKALLFLGIIIAGIIVAISLMLVLSA